MRFRSTPFITAIFMSSAAMFLVPASVRQPAAHSVPSAERQAQTAAAADPPSASTTGKQATPVVQQSPQPAKIGTVKNLRPGPVTLNVNGFWSWALLDRNTGAVVGSPNLTSRSDTASMIKSWLASDYLRRATEGHKKVSASTLHGLSIMIRDSDNNQATSFWRANGGAATIARMISICGLTESRAVTTGSWSTTQVSARDAARLADCIGDGKAAGPQWTGWLLNEMRNVRGEGRFGIIDAMDPDEAPKLAIKNGWINRSDGKWHIACLGVSDDWALSVLTVYPVSLGKAYGAKVCTNVAVQLGTSN